MWLARDIGPASTGSRTEARDLSGWGTIHQNRVGLGTAGSYIRDDDGAPLDRAHFASLQSGDDSEFAFKELDNRSAPPFARLPFGDRFSFDQPALPGGSFQSSQPSVSFYDRFGGEALASSAPVGSVADPPQAAVPQITAAAAAPRPDARSGISRVTPKRQSEPGFRLASASNTSPALAYAPSKSVIVSVGKRSRPTLFPHTPLVPSANTDSTRTAMYYMPARTGNLRN